MNDQQAGDTGSQAQPPNPKRPTGIAPGVYPPSPPLDEQVDRFWEVGPEFDAIDVRITPPDEPLALLEQLGTSPFERGEFPLIGFLATTYDKVSRYALERE